MTREEIESKFKGMMLEYVHKEKYLQFWYIPEHFYRIRILPMITTADFTPSARRDSLYIQICMDNMNPTDFNVKEGIIAVQDIINKIIESNDKKRNYKNV